MKRDWSCIQYSILLGLAAWSGAAIAAGSAPHDQNGFAPPSMSWQAPRDSQIARGKSKPVSVAGEIVDDDFPALYRLPAVTQSNGQVASHFSTSPQRIIDSDQQPLAARDLGAAIDGAPRVATLPSPVDDPTEYEIDEPTFADCSAPWYESQPPATFPYAPAPAHLSAHLLPAVQRGYALAQRGAMSAARTEFIQVLRRIAQSKDAANGTSQHSVALAEGLRALDEAQDFVPAGVQLEAELNVGIVASSHRTPVVRERAGQILTHEAVALYHTYAEERLARATGGEQAGSMVLHGLGKVHARVADRDDDLHAMRSAMTMYIAALAACPTNHLAANELGVLLCRNGHTVEAAQLFEQTINLAPTATNYHNLAVAQQKLGLDGQAGANERESQRLAALERASGALSRRAGVEWVSPQEMSGVGPDAPPAPTAYNTRAPAAEPASFAVGTQPLPRSPWQRTKDFAKSLPFPGRSSAETPLAPVEEVHVARPLPAPATGATRWR